MKVLVAGGAGYVGSVLVERLLQQGDDVTVLDRLMFPTLPPQDAVFVHRDIRQVTVEDMKGYDAVINLAGFSNDPTAEFNPAANIELNTDAAVALAQAAAWAGVSRYVFASSASVYDGSPEADNATETSDLAPVDTMYPYSRSKVLAEQRLAEVAMESDISVVILRKGTVHGFSPRMRYDLVVNAMVGSAIRHGKVVAHDHPSGPMYRPIVDVEDVAEAYIRACQLVLPSGAVETFNICTENLSVLEIAAHVVAGSTSYVLPPHLQIVKIPSSRNIRSYRMSNNRAMAVLGWTPRRTLATSLHKPRRVVAGTTAYGPPDPRLFARALENSDAIFGIETSNIKWMERMIALEASVRGCGPIMGIS